MRSGSTARSSYHAPPRTTRYEPTAGPAGSSTADVAYSAYQSWHHSQTFPCMSFNPKAFAFLVATGCVDPAWKIRRTKHILPVVAGRHQSRRRFDFRLGRRTPTAPRWADGTPIRPAIGPRLVPAGSISGRTFRASSQLTLSTGASSPACWKWLGLLAHHLQILTLRDFGLRQPEPAG